MTSAGPENDFWEFDFTSLKWEKLKTFKTPSPRAGFGFAGYVEDEKNFFVIQGGTCFNGTVNEIFRYFAFRLDLGSLVWELLPGDGEAPLPSLEPTLQIYDGQILQAAGMPDLDAPCLPYLYSYSLSLKNWTVISDRSSTFECRYLARSIIVDDKLMMFFGWLYLQSTNDENIIQIDLLSTKRVWTKKKYKDLLCSLNLKDYIGLLKF